MWTATGNRAYIRLSCSWLELQQIPQIAIEILKYGHRAVAFLDRFAHKDHAFALIHVEIAPKIIGVQKEKDAATRLIADA
jgi:hypothetical protein